MQFPSASVVSKALVSGLALGLAAVFALASPVEACPSRALALGAESFKLVDRESGPVNYYRLHKDPQFSFIRSDYKPPYETAVVGFQVPDSERSKVAGVSWSWRAQKFPNGGDECKDGKGDSAAVVYVTWKRGLRYYTLKYVWSSVGKKGAICDSKRNPFVAQDTVILESGGDVNVWKQESIDLRAAFRKHFEDNDPKASVPDFGGIGLMSDGNQTKSESSADYGNFSIALSGCK